MKQKSLFATGQDLPLFSGTAQRAKIETYKPSSQNQPKLFVSCPICFGTRKIIVKKGKKPIPCPCTFTT
jgi:hypothetical protein